MPSERAARGAPPRAAELADGTAIDLEALAREICASPRNLDIGADVVGARVAGSDDVAAALRDAAAMVRSRPTFL